MLFSQHTARGIAPAIVVSGVAAVTLVGVGVWVLFSGDDVPEVIPVSEKTDSEDIIGGEDDRADRASDLLLLGISEDDAVDLYTRLGLDQDASPEEIREACESLSVLYQNDPKSLFLVKGACDILQDERKRLIYDKILLHQQGGRGGYFGILGLSGDASAGEVRSAYELAARRFLSTLESLGFSFDPSFFDPSSREDATSPVIFITTEKNPDGTLSVRAFDNKPPGETTWRFKIIGINEVCNEETMREGSEEYIEGEEITLENPDTQKVCFVSEDSAGNKTYADSRGGDSLTESPSLTVFATFTVNPDGTLTTPIGTFPINSDGTVTTPFGTFTVNSDGTLTITIGTFPVNSDGTVTTPFGTFPVNSDGTVTTPFGTFTVNSNGTLTITISTLPVNSDGAVTTPFGTFPINSDNTVTTTFGTFTVNSDGTLTITIGTFPINPDNTVTTTFGTFPINSDNTVTTSFGTFSVNSDGIVTAPISTFTVNPNGSVTVPIGTFSFNPTGTVNTPFGTFTISPDGTSVASIATFTINPDETLTTSIGTFPINSDGIVVTPFGSLTVNVDGTVTAPISTFPINSDGVVRTPFGIIIISPDNVITTSFGIFSIDINGAASTPFGDFVVNVNGTVTTPSVTLSAFTVSPYRALVAPAVPFVAPQGLINSLAVIINPLIQFGWETEAYSLLIDDRRRQEYIDILIETERFRGADPDTGDPSDDDTVFEEETPEEETDTDTELSIGGEGNRDFESGEDVADEGPPASRPGAPSLREVARQRTYVTLGWSVPPSNGSPISGYEAHRYVGGACDGDYVEYPSFSGDDTEGIASGLAGDTLYSFRVLARNSVGEGPASNCVTVRTDADNPFTAERELRKDILFDPEDPFVSEGECGVDPLVPSIKSEETTKDSITVSVDRDSICHGIDGGEILRFIVHRYTGTDCEGDHTDFSQNVFDLSQDLLDFRISGLEPSTQYSFKVSFDVSDGVTRTKKGLGCVGEGTLSRDGSIDFFVGNFTVNEDQYLAETRKKGFSLGSFLKGALGVLGVFAGSYVSCKAPDVITAIGNTEFAKDVKGKVGSTLNNILGRDPPTKEGEGLKPDPEKQDPRRTVDIVQNVKECTFDVVVAEVAKDMLVKIAQDYSNYALSGFNGEHPFFVNKKQYFESIVDDAVGKIIDREGLGFLCDTDGFSIDISRQLNLKYRNIGRDPPRCTGSEALDNVQKAWKQVKDFRDAPLDVLSKTELLSLNFSEEQEFRLPDQASKIAVDLETAREMGELLAYDAAGFTSDFSVASEILWGDIGFHGTVSEQGDEEGSTLIFPVDPDGKVRTLKVALTVNPNGSVTLEDGTELNVGPDGSVTGPNGTFTVDPGKWQVYLFRNENRGHHVFYRRDTENMQTAALTINEIKGLLNGWSEDDDIHSVIAEKPIVAGERNGIRYATLARLHLKTSKEDRFGVAGLDEFLLFLKQRDGPEDFGCRGVTNCVENFSWNPWCVTLATDSVVTEGKLVEGGLNVWEYRAVRDSGSHANISLERDLFWMDDVKHEAREKVCRRKPVDGINDARLQVLIQLRPPSVRISPRGQRDQYRFAKAGNKAFFDLSGGFGPVPGAVGSGAASVAGALKAGYDGIKKDAEKTTYDDVENNAGAKIEKAEEQAQLVAGTRIVGSEPEATTPHRKCKPEERENPSNKEEVCYILTADSRDVTAQIQRNNDRILDNANHVDEFGELFHTIFKNTIKGLALWVSKKDKFESMVGVHERSREDIAKSSYFKSVADINTWRENFFSPENAFVQKKGVLSPYYQLARAQIAFRDTILAFNFMGKNLSGEEISEYAPFSWVGTNKNSRVAADLGRFNLMGFIDKVRAPADDPEPSKSNKDALAEAIKNHEESVAIRQIGTDESGILYGHIRFVHPDNVYLSDVRSAIHAYESAYTDTVRAHIDTAVTAQGKDTLQPKEYANVLFEECSRHVEKREVDEICKREGNNFIPVGNLIQQIVFRILESSEAPILMEKKRVADSGIRAKLNTYFKDDCAIKTVGNKFDEVTVDGNPYYVLKCSIRKYREYIEEFIRDEMASVENLIRFMYSRPRGKPNFMFKFPVTLDEFKAVGFPANREREIEMRAKIQDIGDIFAYTTPKPYTDINFYYLRLSGLRAGSRSGGDSENVSPVQAYNNWLTDKVDAQYYHNVDALYKSLQGESGDDESGDDESGDDESGDDESGDGGSGE